MYKKTIEYQTYDDVPETITEDFWFGLNKTELMLLDLGEIGGWEQKINKMLVNRDVPELTKFFTELILKSYGVRSDDRKNFIKNDEIRESFRQSDAFNQLLWELFTVDGAAIEFFREIMPKNIKDSNGKVIELNYEQAAEEAVKRNPELAKYVPTKVEEIE